MQMLQNCQSLSIVKKHNGVMKIKQFHYNNIMRMLISYLQTEITKLDRRMENNKQPKKTSWKKNKNLILNSKQ